MNLEKFSKLNDEEKKVIGGAGFVAVFASLVPVVIQSIVSIIGGIKAVNSESGEIKLGKSTTDVKWSGKKSSKGEEDKAKNQYFNIF